MPLADYPCRRSMDGLVWALWHSLLKRSPAWLLCRSRGIRHGLDWRDCPACGSTLCREVRA